MQKQFATHYNQQGEYQSTPTIVYATSKKLASEKLGVPVSKVYQYNR